MTAITENPGRTGEVRERILTEATRVFARRGYGSASVRELCEAAGVTKPTLYYWFDGKEALFLEAVHAQVAKVVGVVRGSLEGKGRIDERLRRFVRAYVGAVLADPDGVRLLLTVLHPSDAGQPEVDQLSVHLGAVSSLVEVLETARLQGELREEIDPAIAAISLLGAINLHLLGALHGLPVPGDLDATIVRMFLRGVAP